MNRQREVEALMSTYPRSRPALSTRHQASYVEHYRNNRSGQKGLAKVVKQVESWMHRTVAVGMVGGTVLEIGGGNLNHVPYLPDASVYDVVEPFQELWQDSPYRTHVRNMYSCIEQITPGMRYDCIFSVAVLEHLTDLPLMLARVGLLLREGGTFRAAFPSEGGLMWGLGWRLTTGIEYRLKRGLDYGAIMRHEHLNKAREVVTLLAYFYEQVKILRFPIEADHFSLYTAAIAQLPRIGICQSFVASRSASGDLGYE